MAEKGLADAALSLKDKSLKKPDCDITDYTRCIICQEQSTVGMHRVQPTTKEKLLEALEAREDSVFRRLRNDFAEETWLESKVPKWHAGCRNWYMNKKSYQLAKKKRLAGNTSNPQPSSSSVAPLHSTRMTRQNVEAYDAKTQCVICNKTWKDGKEPTSRVSTINSQNAIKEKAKLLHREDILLRLIGQGHDMVANDICYHKPCMDNFKAQRVSGSMQQNLYNIAFNRLVEQLEPLLFKEMSGFLLKTLRDKYRTLLSELGVKTADNYRAITLKWKLEQYFGKRISIINQTSGSGFICASTVPLGDALEKLRKLEAAHHVDEKQRTLHQAAKILRADSQKCKRDTREKPAIDISFTAASAMVPNSLFNFTSSLLCDKGPELDENGRAKVDQSTAEKALIMSQQMLQHVSDIPTPLGTANAYHLYNQTRSKSLIKVSNRLGQGISYDRLQRQLTAQGARIMQQVEEEGVFVPDNMTHASRTPHLFATDNLDWNMKTLEGGSFHATTAIIIENPGDEGREPPGLCVPTSGTQRALHDIPNAPTTVCHISAKDRRMSRSLARITSVHDLTTESDGIAEDILLAWRLGRTVTTSQLLDVSYEGEGRLPGFSAFCAEIHPLWEASTIAYLPLIPASPTDPAVLKDEMIRLVKTAHALGDRHTIITGDQATYELATTIRDKHQDEFGDVILLLGGFHQAHNYLRAICKITREAGAEDLLVTAGLCQEGTARKMFGEKSDYYQSLHALRVLSEAMWRLLWEAFEAWILTGQETKHWQAKVEAVLKVLLQKDLPVEEKLEAIQRARPHLAALRMHMLAFQRSLDGQPKAAFWSSFLEMIEILFRFIYYQREGHWIGHLCESGRMLPYLTAAGHYTYGQQSLPLYLAEMKKLQETAPDVHEAMMRGGFVGRRTDGHHNAVSPDMLLEQTYNADAKEKSGLDGITLSPAARTKWVYTKPITAAVSAQFQSMMHLHSVGPTS